jgi:hypothetical protein
MEYAVEELDESFRVHRSFVNLKAQLASLADC